MATPAWHESPLLERDDELRVLRGALDDAQRAVGGLVVVEGPPGAGKSQLLDATTRQAESLGMAVFRGRGAELEGEMPFGVARQLLGPALAGLETGERDELLGGLAAGAGAVLGAGPVGPAGSQPPSPSLPAADRAVLVDALYWLAYGLARSQRGGAPGVLIVVDDAQWSDDSSLRFLLRTAVGLAELQVALVVALRSGDTDHGELLARLRAWPSARLLRPGPLTEPAVRALAQRRFGGRVDVEFCRACTAATGGNPFLLTELVDSLHADRVAPTAAAAGAVAAMVPETVLRSVLLRLARLPVPASGLARAAALLGPGAALRLGVQVAGLDVAEEDAAAGALVGAGLLSSADPLVFRHPLIAHAVSADVSQLDRARAHRRAAELLAADEAPAEWVAAHLSLTRPMGDRWAAAVLASAGTEARARGEVPGALRLLERALAEPPALEARPAVLVELGLARAAGGQPEAIGLLDEASHLTDDPQRRGRVLLAACRLLLARGQVRAAVRAAERARTGLDRDDPLAVRILAVQLAVMVFLPGAWPDADRLLDEVETAAGGVLPDDPVLLAQLASRRAVWLGQGAERVRPLAEAALVLSAKPGELWQGDASLAAALIYVDAFDLAEKVVGRMSEHAVRTGSPIAAAQAAHWRATLRYRQGWVSDAAADAQRVLDGQALGWSLQTPWSAAVLALAHLELADLPGAQAAIRAGEQTDPSQLPYGVLLHARGEVRLAAADLAGALRDFTAAGEHLRERYSVDNPAVLSWRAGAATALVALGERGRAERLARDDLAGARRIGTPHAIGVALRAVAAAGARDQRVAVLEEAVEVLGGSGAELEHARALCDLGAALRHARRAGAEQPLRQARQLAHSRGAVATERRAERELRLLGARPEPTVGATHLTPAERRVAELAAQDYSNAHIAKSLYLTIRTVEWHLTQTYRKLGLRSRTGLAAALDTAAGGHSSS